jgi:hypothetical protein
LRASTRARYLTEDGFPEVYAATVRTMVGMALVTSIYTEPTWTLTG